MLTDQIIELQLRGPGPTGRTCTAITGCFHDKTKISKENFGAENMGLALSLIGKLEQKIFETYLN